MAATLVDGFTRNIIRKKKAGTLIVKVTCQISKLGDDGLKVDPSAWDSEVGSP